MTACQGIKYDISYFYIYYTFQVPTLIYITPTIRPCSSLLTQRCQLNTSRVCAPPHIDHSTPTTPQAHITYRPPLPSIPYTDLCPTVEPKAEAQPLIAACLTHTLPSICPCSHSRARGADSVVRPSPPDTPPTQLRPHDPTPSRSRSRSRSTSPSASPALVLTHPRPHPHPCPCPSRPQPCSHTPSTSPTLLRPRPMQPQSGSICRPSMTTSSKMDKPSCPAIVVIFKLFQNAKKSGNKNSSRVSKK